MARSFRLLPTLLTLLALILIGTLLVLTTVRSYFGVDWRDIVTEEEIRQWEGWLEEWELGKDWTEGIGKEVRREEWERQEREREIEIMEKERGNDNDENGVFVGMERIDGGNKEVMDKIWDEYLSGSKSDGQALLTETTVPAGAAATSQQIHLASPSPSQLSTSSYGPSSTSTEEASSSSSSASSHNPSFPEKPPYHDLVADPRPAPEPQPGVIPIFSKGGYEVDKANVAHYDVAGSSTNAVVTSAASSGFVQIPSSSKPPTDSRQRLQHSSSSETLSSPIASSSSGNKVVASSKDDIGRDDGLALSSKKKKHRPRPDESTLIPKIIHQTWKGEDLPERWKAVSEKCREMHPDYQYRLWTDSASREFLSLHYPWFLPTFDGYTHSIQRADSIRYFLLHHYGGFYLDLDVGCRRRMDPLRFAPILLPQTIPVGISNDVMASVAKHPFWELAIRNLEGFDRNWILNYPTVMFSTGPMFLSFQYNLWPYTHGVPIFVSSPDDPPPHAALLSSAHYNSSFTAGIHEQAENSYAWLNKDESASTSTSDSELDGEARAAFVEDRKRPVPPSTPLTSSWRTWNLWSSSETSRQIAMDEFDQARKEVRVLPKQWYGKNLGKAKYVVEADESVVSGEANSGPVAATGAEAFWKHYFGSSWHSNDAGFITFLGRSGMVILYIIAGFLVLGLLRLIFTAVFGGSRSRRGSPSLGSGRLRVTGFRGDLSPRGPLRLLPGGEIRLPTADDGKGVLYYLPVWLYPTGNNSNNNNNDGGKTSGWSWFQSPAGSSNSNDDRGRRQSRASYSPLPNYSRPASLDGTETGGETEGTEAYGELSEAESEWEGDGRNFKSGGGRFGDMGVKLKKLRSKVRRRGMTVTVEEGASHNQGSSAGAATTSGGEDDDDDQEYLEGSKIPQSPSKYNFFGRKNKKSSGDDDLYGDLDQHHRRTSSGGTSTGSRAPNPPSRPSSVSGWGWFKSSGKGGSDRHNRSPSPKKRSHHQGHRARESSPAAITTTNPPTRPGISGPNSPFSPSMPILPSPSLSNLAPPQYEGPPPPFVSAASSPLLNGESILPPPASRTTSPNPNPSFPFPPPGSLSSNGSEEEDANATTPRAATRPSAEVDRFLKEMEPDVEPKQQPPSSS